MFNKPRKTVSLRILQLLKQRSTLTPDNLTTYRRLHQGFLGEQSFAQSIKEELDCSHIQLFGLQLKTNGSEYQIDCTLIFQHEIFLIEIKNFLGDYYFEDNNFHLASTKEIISNPLLQLQRSEILLKKFLTKSNSSLSLKSLIIFMNPGFHLYQAPMNSPIIYPNQLERFINSLKSKPRNLNPQHNKISESLKSEHLTKSIYEQIPEYNYEDLKRGIACFNCDGFMIPVKSSRSVICQKCKIIEPTTPAVIRNIKDFHFLFPERLITISAIVEWCDFILSRGQIQYILRRNLKVHNIGRYSYYTLIA